MPVGDPLQDHRAFGDQVAVVELEDGDETLGRHLQVIAFDRRLGLEVDLDQFIGLAGLLQCDLRSEAAGAGGVIEFHG